MNARTAEAPSLAERLEKAREAEVVPRQRVAEIGAALRAAEERRDFAEAGRLEAELGPAREQLGFASALVTALSSQAGAIEAERTQREQARDLAERKDRAQQVIAQALEAARQAEGEGRQHVAKMFELIEAAKASFRAAVSAEQAVGRARRVVAEQRVLTGELPALPPRIQTPNFASVLPQNDRFIQALLAYTGPAQNSRWWSVTSQSGPAPGARGATQDSPSRGNTV